MFVAEYYCSGDVRFGGPKFCCLELPRGPCVCYRRVGCCVYVGELGVVFVVGELGVVCMLTVYFATY